MERSLSTYIEHIKSLSESTQKLFVSAYGSFAGIEELIDSKPGEERVCDALQAWINGTRQCPSTVRLYFSLLRQYLHYRGIKLDSLAIRQTLKFPIMYVEELHPLGLEEFYQILDACDSQRRTMYLAQASSGMRIGEIVQLRRKHVDTDRERIMVKIPPTFTKKRRGRTTFFSSETAELLLPRLQNLGESDLIFGRTEAPKAAIQAEMTYMRRLLNRIGLGESYETNGRHKITTHSLRAYFITKISRRDQNLAKYFAGHRGYLLQYDRLTDEEKLEYYLKFEPDLLVHHRLKSREEIRALEEAAGKVEALEAANSELTYRLRRLEDIIMGMKGRGRPGS